MNEIDIHVLTLPSSDTVLMRQCMASLHHEPCNLYIVNGIVGDLGASRAAGYSVGECEYVAHVDCDDYVHPGAIQACVDYAKANNSAAVVTYERVLYPSGRSHPMPKANHHILVARRDVIHPLLSHIRSSGDYCDKLLMEHLTPTLLPIIGYTWRVGPEGTHNNWDRDRYYEARTRWLTSVNGAE